jgi:pSer/pThr/pTyr-binding forkhead associated (FHA) protein
MPQGHDSVITISLLDPVGWQAVQTWEFDGASVIRIGREKTNDVIISDTLVSRRHGELNRTDAGWSITPLGRNGIAVGSRVITSATPVPHETVLRLATTGPYLEFRVGRRRDTIAEKLADHQRWEAEAHEREEERQRAEQTDATEPDFPKQLLRQKPAN